MTTPDPQPSSPSSAGSLSATAQQVGGSRDHRQVSLNLSSDPVLAAIGSTLAEYASHVDVGASLAEGPAGPVELTLSGPGHRVACVLDFAALALDPSIIPAPLHPAAPPT